MPSPASAQSESPVATDVLTRVRPSSSQLADVAMAMSTVRELRSLGIGHAVAIKDREVMAVDAAEGVAALVRRAGDLCRRGRWSLVVFASESDMPVIDAALIELMKAAGATCLAIDATVPLESEANLLAAADTAKIAITRFRLK